MGEVKILNSKTPSEHLSRIMDLGGKIILNCINTAFPFSVFQIHASN